MSSLSNRGIGQSEYVDPWTCESLQRTLGGDWSSTRGSLCRRCCGVHLQTAQILRKFSRLVCLWLRTDKHCLLRKVADLTYMPRRQFIPGTLLCQTSRANNFSFCHEKGQLYLHTGFLAGKSPLFSLITPPWPCMAAGRIGATNPWPEDPQTKSKTGNGPFQGPKKGVFWLGWSKDVLINLKFSFSARFLLSEDWLLNFREFAFSVRCLLLL